MRTRKKTKAEQAYRRMRRMIIERDIRAGERWSIREVARRLGMSVVPVSEAARQLESDGLIVTRSRSGIRLRQLTPAERSALAVVREALEVQAARIVTGRLARDARKADRLRKLARSLQEHLERGEQGKAALLDYELHLLLVRWAGCRPLTETHQRMALLSKVGTGAWEGSWMRRERMNPGNHMDLVDGLLSGDEQQAEDAVRRHFHRGFPRHAGRAATR